MKLPISTRQNSKGPDVREIQELLNRHGANLTVDGDFGPKTDAAVRAFQSSRGLDVDGIVGPKTLAALQGNTKKVTVQAVLDCARSEIGVGENPSGSNRTKYGEWYGMNGVAWCAIWVSYVFYRAGLPLAFTTSKGFSYCPYGVAAFKKKGQWYTSKPRPGDVVFFNWDGGAVDHVGIVESVNRDGSINTIEGNTSNNKVERRRRTGDIVGYGRPNYA